jgi:hypothetical protein
LQRMATGTEVGCPWIEIRDTEGHLVRRLMFGRKLKGKPFQKGRRLIEEVRRSTDRRMRATGRLIECACSRSKEFGETPLRVATVHLVRAMYEDQTLDDSISHLARGFETLCKRYGTSKKERLGLRLPPTLRAEVRTILRAVAGEIRALTSSGAGPSAESALTRIEGRVQSADGDDNRFGDAVVKLLKAFWFADAYILETHFRDRRGGWAGMLGTYRGDVTHHGYLPILEEGRDVEELVAVRNHLHDALARVILRILRFDGGYRPSVISQQMYPCGVNWVKPHCSAQKLGYE